MVLFFFILISTFFSMLAPPVAAQQEESLPPVVVTATRTETPQQDVTTSISVITTKDIEAQHAETVLEALRNVPGVDVVQSGSRGTTTSIFIRGSNSDQVLVLIDGVEVNSTTLGAFNFAHLTTDNIDRIEVLRGAGGTLYGSQAIGGVNNFLPGTPGDPNAREAAEQYLGKLEWEQKIFPGWDYRISGSIFKEHIKDKDDPEPSSFDGRERSRFRPQIATAEFQTNYSWEELSTTTFGVEFKRRKASTASTFDGFDVGGIDRAIRNMGYYLQEQLRFLDGRLILIPGVRLDDHQTFGTEWSPSFSTAYLFKEIGTKLKAGYAQGFKAPTLNELFFPSSDPRCQSFGNPNLGPERSWELNAGFEQNFIADRVAIDGP